MHKLFKNLFLYTTVKCRIHALYYAVLEIKFSLSKNTPKLLI